MPSTIASTSHVPTAVKHRTLTPLELLDRLARFIPPPRRHLHRYHGVFAPHATPRAQVAARAGEVIATRVSWIRGLCRAESAPASSCGFRCVPCRALPRIDRRWLLAVGAAESAWDAVASSHSSGERACPTGGSGSNVLVAGSAGLGSYRELPPGTVMAAIFASLPRGNSQSMVKARGKPRACDAYSKPSWWMMKSRPSGSITRGPAWEQPSCVNSARNSCA